MLGFKASSLKSGICFLSRFSKISSLMKQLLFTLLTTDVPRNSMKGGGEAMIVSLHVIYLTYKILHGLCPENLRHKFTERFMVSDYRTRNRGNLQIPKVWLAFSQNLILIDSR